MEKKRNPKRTVLIVVAVILAIVMLLLGGIWLYVDYLIGLLVGDDPALEGSTGTVGTLIPTFESNFTIPTVDSLPTEPVITTPPTTLPPANLIDVDDVINIMLLGQDDDMGYGRGRTDTMILCTINTKTKTISLTSFLRDMLVTIPRGWGQNRLNAAYVFEGHELLKETFAYNFGVKIDSIILVKLEMFSQVVDMLGGVDIDLEAREAAHLNEYNWMHNWSLQPGVNHLTGHQALEYSRIRIIDSDFYRTRRQQKVLTSIFNEYKSKPLPELLSITQQILPLVDTYDMTKQDVYDYMFTLGGMISGCSIKTYQIPVDGTYQSQWVTDLWGNNMLVVGADLEANRNYLAQILGAE